MKFLITVVVVGVAIAASAQAGVFHVNGGPQCLTPPPYTAEGSYFLWKNPLLLPPCGHSHRRYVLHCSAGDVPLRIVMDTDGRLFYACGPVRSPEAAAYYIYVDGVVNSPNLYPFELGGDHPFGWKFVKGSTPLWNYVGYGKWPVRVARTD